MRAIGSSFLARARVSRDFENSEQIASFLKERNLSYDVDVLSESFLRVKPHVDESVQDAFYSIFAIDIGKELELKLLKFIQDETATLSKDETQIKPFVIFNVNEDQTELTIRIVLHYGSQSCEFDYILNFQPLADDDVNYAVQDNSALYWLIDDRSPLYSEDAYRNLKIYLLLSRAFNEEISKENRANLRIHARALIKKETVTSKDLPDELISAKKIIINAIRSLNNKTRAHIETVNTYTAVNGDSEYQTIVAITGSSPFSISFGVLRRNLEKGAYEDEFAIRIKESGSLERDPVLFEGREFIKKSLDFDLHRIRFILAALGYRTPHRRSEKLLFKMIQSFPSFSVTDEGENVSINISRVMRFRPEDHEKLRNSFWLYKTQLDRVLKLCSSKKILTDGEIGFVDEMAGDMVKPLPCWKFSDKIESAVNQVHCGNEITFLINFNLTITPKSNLKYLAVIGGYLNEVVNGYYFVKALNR